MGALLILIDQELRYKNSQLVQNPTSTRCLLVTKMEIFAASTNPASTRCNRLVTMLAKLLQTKHDEIFFHGAHPFSKLLTMKIRC